MPEFVVHALDALPHVAQSPLAFVGYVMVVVAWVVVSLRVTRNRNLLESLEKIPPEDRLKALEAEMGTVKLESGLSPEEWIRSRSHLYYLIGFAIACLVLIIIVVVSATSKRPEKVGSDITLYEGPPPGLGDTETGKTVSSDVRVDNIFDGHDMNHGGLQFSVDSLTTLLYVYDRVSDCVVIKPDLPYLDLLRNGGPIPETDHFTWQFPRVSVKLINNTSQTIYVTEVQIEVKRSSVIREPVLCVRGSEGMGALVFTNEGWGKVNSPSIHYAVISDDSLESSGETGFDSVSTPFLRPLESFEESIWLSAAFLLSDHFYRRYLHHEPLTIRGSITYTTDDSITRHVRFQSRLPEPTGEGGAGPPSSLYNVWLLAGKAGYSKRVPVSHWVKPGESEHFVIRIGTNKSSRFELCFTFHEVGSTDIPSQHVLIETFVPRSG